MQWRLGGLADIKTHAVDLYQYETFKVDDRDTVVSFEALEDEIALAGSTVTGVKRRPPHDVFAVRERGDGTLLFSQMLSAFTKPVHWFPPHSTGCAVCLRDKSDLPTDYYVVWDEVSIRQILEEHHMPPPVSTPYVFDEWHCCYEVRDQGVVCHTTMSAKELAQLTRGRMLCVPVINDDWKTLCEQELEQEEAFRNLGTPSW